MNKKSQLAIHILFGIAFITIFVGIVYSIASGRVRDDKDDITLEVLADYYSQVTQREYAQESVPTQTIFAINKDVQVTPYEIELLNGLNPEAQRFFLRSLEIRSNYLPNADYKHFVGGGYGDGSRFEMTPDGYWVLHPGWIANSNPGKFKPEDNNLREQKYYYRYIKDCGTRETIERQIIFKENYGGPILGDQYESQCIIDRSFDTYYSESLDKLE